MAWSEKINPNKGAERIERYKTYPYLKTVIEKVAGYDLPSSTVTPAQAEEIFHSIRKTFDTLSAGSIDLIGTSGSRVEIELDDLIIVATLFLLTDTETDMLPDPLVSPDTNEKFMNQLAMLSSNYF